MQMDAHNYYNPTHRTTRGGRNTRMQDLSSGYYYEHPQQYVSKFISLNFILFYFSDVITIDIIIPMIIINNTKHVQ
jgi:hypothetical protein